MLHQPTSAPSGPRGGNGNTRNHNTPSIRGPSRGGINKRRGGAPRVDRDGDLVMDGGAAAAGRGRGRGVPSRAGQPYPTTATNAIRGAARGGVAVDGVRHGSPVHGGPPRRGAIRGTLDPRRIAQVLRNTNTENAIINRPDRNAGMRVISNEVAGSGKVYNNSKLNHISVRGWTESKAASNPGGGIKNLIEFLERKATGPTTSVGDAVRIVKSRKEGDALIISVKSEDTPKIMRLQDFQFAGATLRLEQVSADEDMGSVKEAPQPLNPKQQMKNFLDSRYDPNQKLLNLSALAKDRGLVDFGWFKDKQIAAKFFLALIELCNNEFKTPEEKRAAIVSVSLADNGLENVSWVTNLSQTFPQIKNLDLSYNKIANLRDLQQWRWKFRELDHLVLTGNPIDSQTAYKDDLLKWFPTVRMLNGEQIRSDEEATRSLNLAQGKLPLPVKGPSFRDEASIAENFVKMFFSDFDKDRSQLVEKFYDAQSTFSIAINTSARHIGNQARWDEYIKKSRNLKKITTLPARMDRMYTGNENISDCWLSLPTTRHPDLITKSEKWNIECDSLPGIPDPTGQAPGGIGGLMIMVHGSFDEIDMTNGKVKTTRSFDRTILLGSGGGMGGIRVVTDSINLRAYGGHLAWVPEQAWIPGQASVTGDAGPSLLGGNAEYAARALAELGNPKVPHGFAVATDGKPYEQLQNELKVLEMSRRTRMTLEYSSMCLETGGWSLEGAFTAFENVKQTLGPEVFLQGLGNN